MNASHPSPHLSGVARRTLDPDDVELVERALLVALANGGGEEIDFQRAPGVSFNPRPARIGLILIQDAGLRTGEEIAAGILACASAQYPPSSALDFPVLTQKILEATREHEKHPEFDSPQSITEPIIRSALVISSAIWLDRARHFHQAGALSRQDWETFIARSAGYASIALRVSPPLHILLQTWIERADRRLQPQR